MATVSPPLPPVRPAPAVPISLWGPWAVLTLLAVAHLPLFAVHLWLLGQRPHYHFFPLVLLGSALLGFAGLRGSGPLRPSPAPAGPLLVGVAWSLALAAALLYSPWLGAVAALVALAAALYGLGGRDLLRRLLPAWAFLWLLIPPPLGLDRQLVAKVQALTVRCASGVLDELGVFHAVTGEAVEVGGRRFSAEEVCGAAGLSFFLPLLAVAVFWVLWARRRPLPAVLLLAAALAWLLLANVACLA